MRNITPAINYTTAIIPAYLLQYGVEPGAGHAVKLLRYPGPSYPFCLRNYGGHRDKMPYKLLVPDEIIKLIRSMHPLLKRRVRAACEAICENPYCGKGLKEELEGLRSFRIKRFRIIYRIISKNKIAIVAVGPRRYIYEETLKLLIS